MNAISNIFSSKQFCYVYPYLSEGIDDTHEYDEVIDIGGCSLVPLLTTNIKAKRYRFITGNIIIKRLYDNIGKVKVSKDDFMRIADRMNVHNNRLTFSFCKSMYSKFGKVRTEPTGIENIIYYCALFEHICRPSFRMIPYVTLFDTVANWYVKNSYTEKEIDECKMFLGLPKLWRVLTDNNKEMIWREILKMDKLIKDSSKRISIEYMKGGTLYKHLFDNEMYKKNVCFISVFDNPVKHTSKFSFDVCTCREEDRMLYGRKKRMEVFYQKCTEHNTPFVFSTVYKLGQKIYHDMDSFVNDNRIPYKMYIASHNRSHLIVGGNVPIIKEQSNVTEQQLNSLWKV